MNVVVCAGVGLLLAACGGSAISEPASGGAAGYSATGGAGNAGGTGNVGGTRNVGGTGNVGGGSNPNLAGVVSQIPGGSIYSCDGTACPGGECNNSDIFGLPVCTETITSGYEYCEPGANGSHCLVVDSPSEFHQLWIVACTDGSAAMWKCSGGCESIQGEGSTCL